MLADPGIRSIANTDAPLTELLAAGVYAREKHHLIWVVGENENLEEISDKLKKWLRFLGVEDVAVTFYTKPFEDPYANNSSDLNAVYHKIHLVSALMENKRLLVLTTRSALGIRIEPLEQLKRSFLKIAVRQEFTREGMIRALIEMGYHARGIVEEKGDISYRGSIVDIFPINGEHPVRIEIEEEKIISMRLFNPDTQKSVEHIQHLLLPPVRFFRDYINNLRYLDDPRRKGMLFLTGLLKNYRMIASDTRKLQEEFSKLMANYETIRRSILEEEQKASFVNVELEEIFDFPFNREAILSIDETFDAISASREWIHLKRSMLDLNRQDISAIKDKLETGGYKLYIFSKKKKLARNLEEYFQNFTSIDYEIPYSFENEKTAAIFLTRRDYQYRARIEQVEKENELGSENLAKDIGINDQVVHEKHGIGRFVGFKTLGFEGNITEFLKIEYLNKEYLYVPVYELDVLSRYVSFEGVEPALDKMGGASWRTKQKRAQNTIISFAKELLMLYAKRKAIKGASFLRDYDLEERLEQDFQYVETEDQKRAIRDVLKDLEAECPMDRLICGDVSFGKTEVAIRAAFRVAANGKQVAVLCPTTILAHQHFATFKKRFAGFPLTIAMLSRMIAPATRKKITAELREGKIDIVIGTHSLLAKGVEFKRLGLYIIDEEQRFGVFQKERLKENREEIDCLSLSATPIPRTLSLSLAGLQDISTIQTPPIGRIAIKNYVGWFSREIVLSAILREVERDGLVFIVYNNIDRIYTFREQLRSWLPEIPAAVIHAKMKSEDIEKNLVDFIEKRFRVLISTTIIENGLDIPVVNTLIVVDANRFGLTQLYQLRGRIGRGSRQAFAYFLVQPGEVSETARMRLDAIREFADLGAGYKIAEFDLKLRGAGSLLGNRQHGHIEALGFDYYHKLLTDTVKELKGEIHQQKETAIKIHFSYSIEPSYIPDSSERISVYRRILEAAEFSELEELHTEMEDRYGRMPASMDSIFMAGVMRILAKKCKLEALEVFTDKVLVILSEGEESKRLFNREFMTRFKHMELEILDKKSFHLYFGNYRDFTQNFRSVVELPANSPPNRN